VEPPHNEILETRPMSPVLREYYPLAQSLAISIPIDKLGITCVTCLMHKPRE